MPDVESTRCIFIWRSPQANPAPVRPQIGEAILTQVVVEVKQTLENLFVLLEPCMLEGIMG